MSIAVMKWVWANSPTSGNERLVLLALADACSGWMPQELASATGANTRGVRNPYAVLAARLSLVELPAPASQPARPPWCGECDQLIRMLDYHGDAPRPCPKCKLQRTRQPNVPTVLAAPAGGGAVFQLRMARHA